MPEAESNLQADLDDYSKVMRTSTKAHLVGCRKTWCEKLQQAKKELADEVKDLRKALAYLKTADARKKFEEGIITKALRAEVDADEDLELLEKIFDDIERLNEDD
jgi:hypothetical protein